MCGCDVTHSSVQPVYIFFFFLKIVVFLLPSAGRHYFENRSARERRRQLPSSPAELVSSWISIFKGCCTERKGGLGDTDSQSVHGLRQSRGLMATDTAADSNSATLKA